MKIQVDGVLADGLRVENLDPERVVESVSYTFEYDKDFNSSVVIITLRLMSIGGGRWGRPVSL